MLIVLRDLALESATISPQVRAKIRQLAAELSPHAVLPVIGAGASLACGSPSAGRLASELAARVNDGTIGVSPKPSDLTGVRKHLGKLADLVHLHHPIDLVLDQIGFRDLARWPDAEGVLAAYKTSPHPCPYRVLARMARERFIAESITFNYDCHYEGGLRKEGFFPDRRLRHGRWPELFSVVADARTHSSVLSRGDVVVNKVHGCVDTWRRASRVTEQDRERADNAIVIRWSQLLDWRTDWWSRDLVRDRARRHILLLIGFSGLDPVIHSTLQAVMREVLDDERRGAARIRVIDTAPNQLSLQLLTAAGRGDDGQITRIRIPRTGSPSLAAVLLALLNELIRARLAEHARRRGFDPHLPSGNRSLDLRLAVSGPAMLRWTWGLLAKTEHGPPGLPGLTERRDDYYIPLTVEPERTLRTFRLRDELAKELEIDSETPEQASEGAFLLAPRRGRAYMPLGLHDHEIGALSQTGILEDVGRDLFAPKGLERLVVTEKSGRFVAYSIDTGEEADL
jgi:SIR2-like domain